MRWWQYYVCPLCATRVLELSLQGFKVFNAEGTDLMVCSALFSHENGRRNGSFRSCCAPAVGNPTGLR